MLGLRGPDVQRLQERANVGVSPTTALWEHHHLPVQLLWLLVSNSSTVLLDGG